MLASFYRLLGASQCLSLVAEGATQPLVLDDTGLLLLSVERPSLPAALPERQSRGGRAVGWNDWLGTSTILGVLKNKPWSRSTRPEFVRYFGLRCTAISWVRWNPHRSCRGNAELTDFAAWSSVRDNAFHGFSFESYTRSASADYALCLLHIPSDLVVDSWASSVESRLTLDFLYVPDA